MSLVEPEAWFMIPDRVRRNEALADVLRRNGFSPREVHDVAEVLKEHMNLRHLRRGDEVEIHFAHDGGVAIRIHRGLLESYEAHREGGGWDGGPVPIHFDREEVIRHGTLRGSLFASMDAMGETAALVEIFAEVFQWDFDFHTQSRRGDRFSVMVEKVFRDGRFVGYGDLKAARYVSGNLDLAAFLYEYPPDKRGYYDREGKSMRKAFLRSPLTFTRISSGFSYSRLHPVHKRRMPHTGVDYAAPTGTPVHTVAGGTVVGISRKGAGGNQVTIRHAMGYQSGYLHLSRFARGLRVGKRVAQKEVIGYVGKTGTATGPHLDFRLWRHGKPVNPLRQIYPPGPPVPEEYMPNYQKLMRVLAGRLNMSLPTMTATTE
jgi:murein DD-endopeptidase MepM/ murein hydrolase activator NlpD